MTAAQFSRALTKLGVTQAAFAATIKVNERTVRNWVGERSEVPTAIAMLVNLMLETKTGLTELQG